MFLNLVETCVVLVVLLFYYKKEKPRILYGIFAVFAYVLTLLFRFPLYYLKEMVSLTNFSFSILILVALTSVVTIFLKFYSLRNYLSRKLTLKNGLFFAILLASLESLSYLREVVYDEIVSFFSLSGILAESFVFTPLSLFDFFFWYMISLCISILLVVAVLRKSRIFFLVALLSDFAVHFVSLTIAEEHRLAFMGSVLFLALLFFLHHKKIVK